MASAAAAESPQLQQRSEAITTMRRGSSTSESSLAATAVLSPTDTVVHSPSNRHDEVHIHEVHDAEPAVVQEEPHISVSKHVEQPKSVIVTVGAAPKGRPLPRPRKPVARVEGTIQQKDVEEKQSDQASVEAVQPAIEISQQSAEASVATRDRTSSALLNRHKHMYHFKTKKVASSDGVYIERKGYFNYVKSDDFDKEQAIAHKKSVLGNMITIANFIPPKYKDVILAFQVQKAFHNFAFLIIGPLCGLSCAEALFAVFFVTRELLLQGYRYLSLPIHVLFAVCYMIGCIAASDRLNFFGWTLPAVWRTIAQNGLLNALLWYCGFVASILCIEFDENLAPIETAPNVTDFGLTKWQVLCITRAILSALAWILIGCRPSSDCLNDNVQQAMRDDLSDNPDGALESLHIPSEVREEVSKLYRHSVFRNLDLNNLSSFATTDLSQLATDGIDLSKLQ